MYGAYIFEVKLKSVLEQKVFYDVVHFKKIAHSLGEAWRVLVGDYSDDATVESIVLVDFIPFKTQEFTPQRKDNSNAV